PPWELLGLIPIAMAVAVIAIAPGSRAAPLVVPDAPGLFPPKGTAPCPNVTPDQRGALAAEKLRIALAKRERSPFAPQDGIEAVQLFEISAACWRMAGGRGGAGQAGRFADTPPQ